MTGPFPLTPRVLLMNERCQIKWIGRSGTPPLYRKDVPHIAGDSTFMLISGPLTPKAAPELHADKAPERRNEE